jgi:uncharacterized membrane protein
MSKGKTIVIGLGLATGALLVTWLLTGSRKEKTKQFIAKRTTGVKETLSSEKAKKRVYEDSNSYYI